MKKCILIAIRYSVLFSAKTKGFHLSNSQSDVANYKEVLFSKERMTLRENLFKRFTLPSLKSVFENTDPDIFFRVIVMASSELPEEHKDFLFNVERENNDWLSLQFMEPDKVNYGKAIYNTILNMFEEQEFFCATVRLDDDDALYSGYCNTLKDMMDEEYDKSIVSFSCGYNVYVADCGDEIIGSSVYRHIKNSAGLAYVKKYNNFSDIISDNIYTCGNHEKVDEFYRLIDVNDCYSYIRVNTETSDRMYNLTPSERKNRLVVEFKKQKDKVPFRDVLEKFSIDILDI
ncbi:glycosyltransferase [Vibrio metschnikovii]|uniref:Rhamnosyl transferase n=1 Tax=Vibrio metschnikovii TaxID=28172 RepID=A0A9X0RCH3_VIBME|nr:glycosyltransferase [Vibrio metschnikovii]MBC5851940.1 hypothetical protein [Vibrio metschnikovii]